MLSLKSYQGLVQCSHLDQPDQHRLFLPSVCITGLLLIFYHELDHTLYDEVELASRCC